MRGGHQGTRMHAEPGHTYPTRATAESVHAPPVPIHSIPARLQQQQEPPHSLLLQLQLQRPLQLLQLKSRGSLAACSSETSPRQVPQAHSQRWWVAHTQHAACHPSLCPWSA